MQIHQIPILQDNYCHILVDETESVLACVDPAEPEVLIPFLREFELPLEWLLCTHHHWDHAGGNAEMLKAFPEAKVVASVTDAPKIQGVHTTVSGGDRLTFGPHEIEVITVPCHTRGHVAYLSEGNLFCGDTLFVAGCGRFFEGDAAEMDQALNGIFAKLPPSTRVFCGHEYTVANLEFALSVEPGNPYVREKLEWARSQQENDDSTVPSTLGEELNTNPFMRTRTAELRKALGGGDPVELMARLRQMKNEFKRS